MRDRETELHYYPKERLSLQGVSRVLCVAPHPDDEVLGSAGCLTLLVRQGAVVQSVIITRGDKALGEASTEHANERTQESLRAAEILGTPPPKFLDFEDRTLGYSPALIKALEQAMQTYLTSEAQCLLLLPSLSEPHPDHQAVALAGLAAAQGWVGPLRVLFYEVGAPLHPNTYLDITEVEHTKWQALAQFDSQLKIEHYESHARAFASLRAFGLGNQCVAAEAFFEVDLAGVRRSGPLLALPQWPWVRSHLQLANRPQDLPLVSVLIRSMDRPTLAETLASVALQTYSHIEVVLVNAGGQAHTPLDYLPGHVKLRIVDSPNHTPLGRSQAANLALQQAQGDLALFLDDDDLIGPLHLQQLVQVLQDHPRAAGAYSGVQVIAQDGTVLREYDCPWSYQRLAGINFLPIHAVLFRLQAVRQCQIQFDEALPVLEDWDFWRRLFRGQELLRCPGVTAIYRQGLGQSRLGDPEHANHWKVWHLQLLLRYLAEDPPEQTADVLAWHAIEVDRLGTQLDQLHCQKNEMQKRLAQSESDLLLQRQQALQHQNARDRLQQELERFSLQMQAELAAQEAKLQTYALQATKALSDKELLLQTQAQQHLQTLADKEAQLQRFALQSQQALDDKEAQLQEYARQSRNDLDRKYRQLHETTQQLQHLQETLVAIQTSRWWRWGSFCGAFRAKHTHELAQRTPEGRRHT